MSHSTQLRVRFYELDPYDHVNHTNYLNYFETARVEYLADVGLGLDVMKREGIHIVVVELRARFLAAAGLHDTLDVTTSVIEVGRVKTTWAQEMRRGPDLLATLEISAAFTSTDGKPQRIPARFAELLSPPVPP